VVDRNKTARSLKSSAGKTDLSSFDAIACGPGLTLDATPILQGVLEGLFNSTDTDGGLNILAQMELSTLSRRQA